LVVLQAIILEEKAKGDEMKTINIYRVVIIIALIFCFLGSSSISSSQKLGIFIESTQRIEKTCETRKIIYSWEKEICNSCSVSSIWVYTLNEYEDLADCLRLYNVDLALALKIRETIKKEHNPLGMSYLLIFPALFVPGTNVDCRVDLRGELINRKDGRNYFTLTTSKSLYKKRPCFRLDEDCILCQTTQEALDSFFKDDFIRMLQGLDDIG
jgi:hypothetical protein